MRSSKTLSKIRSYILCTTGNKKSQHLFLTSSTVHTVLPLLAFLSEESVVNECKSHKYYFKDKQNKTNRKPKPGIHWLLKRRNISI